MASKMGTAATLLKMLDLFQQGQMSTEKIYIIRTRINGMVENGATPDHDDWEALFASVFYEANRVHEPAKLQQEGK